MNTMSKNLNIAKRYRKEKALIRLGQLAIIIALMFLAVLLINVVSNGWRGLLTADIALEINFNEEIIGENGENDVLAYNKLITESFKTNFPDNRSRKERKDLKKLFSFGGGIYLKSLVETNNVAVGEVKEIWLPTSSIAELHLKAFELLPGDAEEGLNLSEFQVRVLEELKRADKTRLGFNFKFFTLGDSRDPELAGIGGALMGSLLSLFITLVLTFPIAVATAIYLELLAPRNKFFDFIEVNINNLAAVPSIIMGLLGLAVLINLLGLPRSTPIVGGIVLGFLTLPTIIIAARAALKAVPATLLQAALSLGATKIQGIFHQILPAAMPGILTGTIIGMAGALGETAPLLMIGMVAFVVSVPNEFTDVATALPVQIYLWADSPERGFVEKTSLAICVLILFLLLMNALAIYLRKYFEKYK